MGKVIWDTLRPDDPMFSGRFVTSSVKVSRDSSSSTDTSKTRQSKTGGALKGGKSKA